MMPTRECWVSRKISTCIFVQNAACWPNFEAAFQPFYQKMHWCVSDVSTGLCHLHYVRRPMNWTFIAPLLLISLRCLAAQPEFAYASGFAADDTKIVFRETQGEMTFVSADVRGNQLSSYFSVEKECRWREGKAKEQSRFVLTCRLSNKSPLSGVAYEAIKEPVAPGRCGQLAYTLKCVAGCQRKSVPKELYAENC